VKTRKIFEKGKAYSDKNKKSNWIEIGNGFLKIGHKPGGKKHNFQTIFNENTGTVLTILSEREGAISIGENCKSYGMDWI